MLRYLYYAAELVTAAGLILLPVALSYLGCGLGYTCP